MICEVCGREVLRGYPKCYGPNDVECYRLGYERLRRHIDLALSYGGGITDNILEDVRAELREALTAPHPEGK